jgi:hypothetical protein
MLSLPTMPDGWPIASYGTYGEAQRAVDYLADKEFPLAGVAIVGVEPMLVERVAARLTWRRVLGGAVASGAWLGMFVGLLLTIFTPSAGALPILIGLVAGVAFAMISSAVSYAGRKGQRDFVSYSQLVARRYDVLAQPRSATQGRNLLAALALKAPAVSATTTT